MAEPLTINVTRAATSTPATYTVPGAVEVEPLSAFATFDGTGAATAFLPSLAFYSAAGLLVARAFPSDTVAAGGTADVSYFPGVGGQTPTNTSIIGSGGVTLLFDYTVPVASQASIDTAVDGTFAGTLRSDLTYLEVYLTGRTDEAINRSNIGWWFNGDTVQTDYDRIAISSAVAGTPIQVQVLAGQTTSGTIAGSLLTGGVPGMNRCFIPDYASTVFWKLCEFTSWVTDNVAGSTRYEIGLNAIMRESADPITRIMVTPDTVGAKFITGTRLSVWAR